MPQVRAAGDGAAARKLLAVVAMETRRPSARSFSRRRPTSNGTRPKRSAVKGAGMSSRTPVPDAWWDVDTEILSVLADGAKSPEDIAKSLDMSGDAVMSLVAILAQQGKVRIRLVEAVA
jgi:hypothetical protein